MSKKNWDFQKASELWCDEYSDDILMDFVMKLEKKNERLKKKIEQVENCELKRLTKQEKYALEMAYNKEVFNFVRNEKNSEVMNRIAAINYAFLVENKWLMLPLDS